MDIRRVTYFCDTALKGTNGCQFKPYSDCINHKFKKKQKGNAYRTFAQSGNSVRYVKLIQ